EAFRQQVRLPRRVAHRLRLVPIDANPDWGLPLDALAPWPFPRHDPEGRLTTPGSFLAAPHPGFAARFVAARQIGARFEPGD
ncbi:hypothetical protein OFM36_37350, partial [Escherichia coli]|nr:hypothetical protein [Escherichia coli]